MKIAAGNQFGGIVYDTWPQVYEGQSPLPDYSWSHVALVYSHGKQTITLYVNGVEDNTIPCTGDLDWSGHMGTGIGGWDQASTQAA